MKHWSIIMVALIVTGCANLDLPSPGKTLESESEVTTGIDCNLVIGRWSGEKIWNAERTSRWLATYQADGELQIDFTTNNKGEERQESHTGSWDCRKGLLQTTTTDPHLETRNYMYRIQELSERFMHYQVITANGLGPKFVSERVR